MLYAVGASVSFSVSRRKTQWKFSLHFTLTQISDPPIDVQQLCDIMSIWVKIVIQVVMRFKVSSEDLMQWAAKSQVAPLQIRR